MRTATFVWSEEPADARAWMRLQQLAQAAKHPAPQRFNRGLGLSHNPVHLCLVWAPWYGDTIVVAAARTRKAAGYCAAALALKLCAAQEATRKKIREAAAMELPPAQLALDAAAAAGLARAVAAVKRDRIVWALEPQPKRQPSAWHGDGNESGDRKPPADGPAAAAPPTAAELAFQHAQLSAFALLQQRRRDGLVDPATYTLPVMQNAAQILAATANHQSVSLDFVWIEGWWMS